VCSMLSAPFTILLYLNPVRIILLVLVTAVISSFTFCTFKSNYLSHNFSYLLLFTIRKRKLIS